MLCIYEMVDWKIICLWNIDENLGYLCGKPFIRQSNHKLSEKLGSIGYNLWVICISAAVTFRLNSADKHMSAPDEKNPYFLIQILALQNNI